MLKSNFPPLELLQQFAIPGSLVDLVELKRGHINYTYVGTWVSGEGTKRFVHQKVNHEIFRDVPGLMKNMQIVTDRIRRHIADGTAAPGDLTLTIVPTRDDRPFLVDAQGEYWRTFNFIEHTINFDVCPGIETARQSAAILGRFQRYLADVSAPSLCDTIPHFHDGERRFVALEEAIRKDVAGRVSAAMPHIEFAMGERRVGASLISALRSGQVPLRVTHNDMKLNNVLFDERTKDAICLVDLDTCMPGTALFDFGDLVRNTAVPCAEDEPDLSKVAFDRELYRALCQGYLAEFGSLLTEEELALLPVSPRVLALVLGIRFLTDHLSGDVYFRTHREGHNLDRARTQFQVVKVMAAREQEMLAIAKECLVA